MGSVTTAATMRAGFCTSSAEASLNERNEQGNGGEVRQLELAAETPPLRETPVDDHSWRFAAAAAAAAVAVETDVDSSSAVATQKNPSAGVAFVVDGRSKEHWSPL